MDKLQARLAVIGGTGLYQIDGMTDIGQYEISTPFGSPSDSVTIGELNGTRIAFLPRHGRTHSLLPSEIPSRANIYALKTLGVEEIIAINSVGSFDPGIHPGDLCIPDQLIDRTTRRPGTFFGEGIVAHIQFADPFCAELSRILLESAREAGATAHMGGTYVVMEGPAFSTRAESKLHQSWGASVIGMTALPEAKLAREAEICYAVLACTTDYDSWHIEKESVSVELILKILQQNVAMSRHIIQLAANRLREQPGCTCRNALANAIVTPANAIPADRKQALRPIIGKYVV